VSPLWLIPTSLAAAGIGCIVYAFRTTPSVKSWEEEEARAHVISLGIEPTPRQEKAALRKTLGIPKPQRRKKS
jgi:hypothetical protein